MHDIGIDYNSFFFFTELTIRCFVLLTSLSSMYYIIIYIHNYFASLLIHRTHRVQYVIQLLVICYDRLMHNLSAVSNVWIIFGPKGKCLCSDIISLISQNMILV